MASAAPHGGSLKSLGVHWHEEALLDRQVAVRLVPAALQYGLHFREVRLAYIMAIGFECVFDIRVFRASDMDRRVAPI